jgi:hypothetical protein
LTYEKRVIEMKAANIAGEPTSDLQVTPSNK